MSRLFAVLIARALLGVLLGAAANAYATQNTTVTFTYDAVGNLKTVTNGLSHTTTYGYDSLSRRTSETDATATGITKYDYDGLDQLIKVTDPRNVVTSYTVNGLGELTQTSSGDTGSTISLYDEAGNLTSRTDAKQQTTTYKYDALNRITLITYHDNGTVAYTYDQGPNAIGKLSHVADASGTIQYYYNAFGQIAAEARTLGGATHTTFYRYDDTGRLSGMSYPSGRNIEYVRDTLGRISKVTALIGVATTPVLTDVAYQPFGPVRSVTFGNGRTQERSYDRDGRITSFSLSAQTMGLTYDAANRIKAITDPATPATGSTYDYDVLDRLTNVATAGSAQTYVYDAVGNRKQKVNNSAVTNYAYGAANNRLTQVGAQAIATDVNGSITDKVGATFNYDARGRMVSANTAIGLVTYTINSLGQRVRKVTPTETTVFHYDMAGKLIAESTTVGSTTTTQEYVYLGDMPVAVLK
ncbi:MAG: hypothetical protein WKG03_10125 [Telluria sp.]